MVHCFPSQSFHDEWMSSLIVLSHSVMSNSWNPIDCSLPGSSVHGILQARILEWFAISFSRGSSGPRNQTRVSCIVSRVFTDWTTREVWLNEFNFAVHSQKLTINVIWGINTNYLGIIMYAFPTLFISFHLYRNLWDFIYIYVLLSFGDKCIEPQTRNLIKFF